MLEHAGQSLHKKYLFREVMQYVYTVYAPIGKHQAD